MLTIISYFVVYDTDIEVYIGSKAFQEYSGSLGFINVDDVLYIIIGLLEGDGALLRWNVESINIFNFETIRNFESEAANIAYHEGRIFINTWPDYTNIINFNIIGVSIYISSLLPEGGLQKNPVIGQESEAPMIINQILLLFQHM
jgi:hypothetical protein